MERRQFFGLVGGLVTTSPLVARAQQRERVRRIVMPNVNSIAQAEVTAFLDALKALGWAEGRNLQADVRWGPVMRTNSGCFQRNWSICDQT
jgi:hypothetical protein